MSQRAFYLEVVIIDVTVVISSAVIVEEVITVLLLFGILLGPFLVDSVEQEAQKESEFLAAMLDEHSSDRLPLVGN